MIWLVGACCFGVASITFFLLGNALRNSKKFVQFIERHLFPDRHQVRLTAQCKTTPSVYRILAFGDDMTEGATCNCQAFHPYMQLLGDKLHPLLPLGIHLEIEEQGVRRDTVLDGMKRRLQHTLMQHAAVGRPYNWVLLQGGSNDLTGPSTASAPEVMAGLEELVQLCLAHGASVMLMTLLEAPSAEAAVQEQCQQLNKLIRAFVANKAWEQPSTAAAGSQQSDSRPVTAEIRMRGAAAAASAGGANKVGNDAGSSSTSPLRTQPTVALCDLATYLPYSELTEQERWELWHNDTQLTVDGYDAVGLLLFNSLAPRVKRQLATGA